MRGRVIRGSADIGILQGQDTIGTQDTGLDRRTRGHIGLRRAITDIDTIAVTGADSCEGQISCSMGRGLGEQESLAGFRIWLLDPTSISTESIRAQADAHNSQLRYGTLRA